ncbi:hypothetical protein LUZ62_081014 [Rhynchospora pubera]|uniref:Uncharacterized protein n=1 Tax=Rhynchospora pubera TaxID=906938 RepID=A0AAV8BU13_9POAL|nr:hypothetical protein LUZ62_081014 [Rhynchospora pubera]
MASLPTPLSVLTTQHPSSPKVMTREAEFWKSRHLWLGSYNLAWSCRRLRWHCAINSSNVDSSSSSKDSFVQLDKDRPEPYQRLFSSMKETVHVMLPVVASVRTRCCSKFAIMVYVASAIFIIIARKMMPKQENHVNQGSIADLVRRGQLKSNRRGFTKTGLYDNPFNNSFVKIDENNSTAQMFGKVYRLAPTTLTKEQQLTHQERRARAYQWKRPKVFLKEGDPVPPGVDPDSVRFIPSNHPFASTSSDINEETVRNNVYQKGGVPFRVRAEHEALQKKLEALQDETKIKELAVNLKNPEFEEPWLQQIEHNETKKQDDKIDKGSKSSNENGNDDCLKK